MKNLKLIKKYTQGLADATAGEKEFLSIEKELSDFSAFLSEQKKLKEVLSSPFLSRNKKIQIVNDILKRKKLNPKANRFVMILFENNRIELLPDILDYFPVLWKEKKGIFTYEVASVVPLNPIQKKKLEKKLEALENNRVLLKYKIDSQLLGGLTIKRGNAVYDISLKGNLSKMKEKIIQG
jgi:F-type H+-transporting ATPase subunit delta